ncbi:MAG: Rv1355c family protein [Phycisphaerae bacterium]|nr:Rv1355c family protein [Saprospiraceae bacterium]
MNTGACLSNKHIWQPEIFRLCIPSNRERFESLLASSPHIIVHDEIVGQIHELLKCRAPHRHFEHSELVELTQQHLNGSDTDSYGVWVWYPWENRMVHLLDEAEFVALRTARNQLKITAQEQASLQTKIIGIVGLSVGQSIALTLAMERGCGELRLADFDTLELSNMNRIRTGVHNLGLPKVVIAAREIATIDPFLRVEIFPEGITTDNIEAFFTKNGRLDLVFDECDSLDVKILLRQQARSMGVPVLMDTNDRGMLDVERFDLEPDRPLLHGLAGDLSPESLRDLTTEEKIPFVQAIIGLDSLSPRMKESMPQIGKTLSSWPQLASSVALGGALGADTSRRILLHQFRDSGRYYIDLEALVADKAINPEPEFSAKKTKKVGLEPSASVQKAESKTQHIRIRAFRATDEPATCHRYFEGHRQRLKGYGIEKLSSLGIDWCNNPHCTVIVAEAENGRLLGGVRLEKSSQKFQMPIEKAVAAMDHRIEKLVRRHRMRGGIGELCGLWVSEEAQGTGLKLALNAYGLAIYEQVGVGTLAGFSSPHMLSFCEKVGWRAEPSVGKGGVFEYPAPGVLSTVILHNLELCAAAERQKILEIRQNAHPVERFETVSGQVIQIRYEAYRPAVLREELFAEAA